MPDEYVSEKIGQLSAKADAAHSRIDKLETDIRSDLKDLKLELKELNAYMNRSKALVALVVFLSGASGAAFVKLFTLLQATH